MKLRSAVIDDVDKLKALLIGTIKSTCKNDYNQEQINAWASSAKKVEHWDKFIDEQFSLVAEIDNKIVGFGSLEDGDSIYFMYVHKDYLGQGIASAIFSKLVKESKRLGYAQVTANVSKTALSFFKSKGFEIVKENKNVINKVTIINYRMVKTFNA